MIQSALNVLLFEDNPGDVRLIEELLNDTPPIHFSYKCVESIKDGLDVLTNGWTNVILLDLGLPDSQGIASLLSIIPVAHQIPIIVLTGLNDPEISMKAVQAGAQDYLIKGEFSKDMLIRTIRYSINRKQAENALNESEERFRTIIENSDAGYFFIDSDGIVINSNSAWAKLYGYNSFEEVIGHHYTEIQRIDDIAKAQLLIDGIIKLDKKYMSGEISRKCKNGTLGYHTYSARPVRHLGKVIGFEGFIIDTTARRIAENEIRKLNQELENRVQERTQQLNSANKELEAFSYSVSHDLRAPLRAMDGYCRIMLSDYSNQLDKTEKEYLDNIILSTNKMNALIDDLLSLAHISKVELIKGELNLTDMVNNIARQLGNRSEERKITWSIAPKVKGYGDEGLLEAALTNLLNNAYKFSSQHEVTHIEFGTKKENEKTIYYIKDDGAGFDMVHINQLFEAFHRLPSAEKFEGTGIGLNIVKRIINRHGGKIWAEGEIDKGATFYFTLN